MARLRTPVANAHIAAVQRLAELEALLAQLEIPAECLESCKEELAALIDGLPIDWRGADRKNVKFFALVGGEWWPCHKGEQVVDEDDPLCGGLRYKVLAADGSVITAGYAKPHEWAHVATDGSVDYQWMQTAPVPA